MKVYSNAQTGAVLRARQLRRDSTEAEKTLWRELRTKLPNYKWRRQMPIGPYFADFACHSTKLVIELDGGQHANAQANDSERTRFMETQGFRVIRFWNNDIVDNVDGVLHRITQELTPA